VAGTEAVVTGWLALGLGRAPFPLSQVLNVISSNKPDGHFTIFISQIEEGEAEVVLQLCTLLLVLDITPQVQVLLHFVHQSEHYQQSSHLQPPLLHMQFCVPSRELATFCTDPQARASDPEDPTLFPSFLGPAC
jgi:hypothetical protein